MRGELGPPLGLSWSTRSLSASSGIITSGLVLSWVGRAVPPGQGLCSDTCSFCLPGTTPPPPKRSPAWGSPLGAAPLLPSHSPWFR